MRGKGWAKVCHCVECHYSGEKKQQRRLARRKLKVMDREIPNE
jgi:hypothetical protein